MEACAVVNPAASSASPYMHACLPTHASSSTSPYMHACLPTHASSSTSPYMHACLPTHAASSASPYMHACLPTHAASSASPYMHACLPTHAASQPPRTCTSAWPAACRVCGNKVCKCSLGSAAVHLHSFPAQEIVPRRMSEAFYLGAAIRVSHAPPPTLLFLGVTILILSYLILSHTPLANPFLTVAHTQ
eukprot:364478-Chlamydomonas_euryale.AAC.21